MLPAQPNQSLVDGLAVLQALTAADAPVGGRALGRQLDLEPTRTNRLLKTLAHLGLAQQGADRRYAAGPAVHVLAAQALRASGLVGRAIEPLRELGQFELIVAMGVLWRTEVCYTYFASPGASLNQSLGSRDSHPATTSGLGIAMLADLDDAEVCRRFKGKPTPGYADVNELIDHLSRIRRDGYAMSTVQRVPGNATLAVAVGRPAIAAIGLAGSIDRRRINTYVSALQQAAELIEPNPGKVETP